MSEANAQAQTDEQKREDLLTQFQRVVAEYRQAKDNQDATQTDFAYSIELLNLASVGFGVACSLVPQMRDEINRLLPSVADAQAANAEVARLMAKSLTRMQRWVLRSAANGDRIICQGGLSGNKDYFRVGDTFYMGGDPDFDAKDAAVRVLCDAKVLARLPMSDVRSYGSAYYRLTDFGVLVAEQSVALDPHEEVAE